jgi:integrase
MPKNGKVRYAPLSQELADEVKRYVSECKISKELFMNKKNEYYSYNTFRKCYFFKDIAETGIRKTRFHNCRYFYVREYLQKGGVEAQLRKIVGHACQRMTDRYNTLPKNMNPLAQVMSI